MSTQTKLNKLAAALKTSLSYNYENKEAFKKAGLSAFRALEKEMGFTESRVSFNPGGIAVSGDHYLYGMFSEGEGVMITVSQGAFSNHAGYCRHIKSLTDYSGGANVWIEHKELADVEKLKVKLREVARLRRRLF